MGGIVRGMVSTVFTAFRFSVFRVLPLYILILSFVFLLCFSFFFLCLSLFLKPYLLVVVATIVANNFLTMVGKTIIIYRYIILFIYIYIYIY